MCRKRRVIAAAVFHMQDQGNVQKLCLKRRIFAVRAQDMKDRFRGGQFGQRLMDKQAFAVMVMAVCLVAVYRKQRE